jgi:hypothetical protein
VLAFAPLCASAFFGKLVALFEFRYFFFDIHGGRIIAGRRTGRCEGDHMVVGERFAQLLQESK